MNSADQIPELLISLAENNSAWWNAKHQQPYNRVFEYHGDLPAHAMTKSDKYPIAYEHTLQNIGINISKTPKLHTFIDSSGQTKTGYLYGNIEIKYKIPCSQDPDEHFIINVHILHNQAAKRRVNIKTDFMHLVFQEFKRLDKTEMGRMNECISIMRNITLFKIHKTLQSNQTYQNHGPYNKVNRSIILYPKSIQKGAVTSMHTICEAVEKQQALEAKAKKIQRLSSAKQRFHQPQITIDVNPFAILADNDQPTSPTL